MLLMTKDYFNSAHLMHEKPINTRICSGIKVNKIKDKAKSAMKKISRFAKKATEFSAKNKEKVLNLLTNPAVQDVVKNIPYVGPTINTITSTTKKVVDKAHDYMTDKSKIKPENIIDDVKEVKDDLLKDKNIQDAITKLKEKIKSSNLKDKEKDELISNADDLNISKENEKLGGRLALGMLIPKDKRDKEKLTIPAKYRKMFGISQKSLANKGGKLYKKVGNGCSGKITDKNEILKILTKK